MEQIRDDLWVTDAERPFPGLVTRAYLLATPADGNVLFYNTSHHHEIEAMAELGGVQRQYLSHQDEIAPSLRQVRERHGATLLAHRSEAHLVAEVSPVEAFDERGEHPGGIEVIPTPGHTVGSTCYVATTAAGDRYLFTGDTLFVGQDGRWAAGYIPGHSDAAPLAASLHLIRGLAPDLVVSSACPTGVGAHLVDPDEWPELVDAAAEGLRARV